MNKLNKQSALPVSSSGSSWIFQGTFSRISINADRFEVREKENR
ncbi:MAG: hypothetical protein ACFB16_23245 [Phormidesmis sp.]